MARRFAADLRNILTNKKGKEPAGNNQEGEMETQGAVETEMEHDGMLDSNSKTEADPLDVEADEI